VLLVSCAWMLFTPPLGAAVPAHAEARTGAGFADEAGTEIPAWHVARTDVNDRPGVRNPPLDQDSWDIGENTDSDEFDSEKDDEEFESHDAADNVVTPNSGRDEPGTSR